jgi:hypothetical protein
MVSRSRVSTALKSIEWEPVASGGGSSATAGALAAAAWVRDRGTSPPTTTRWNVEIALDVLDQRAPSEYDDATSTRFHLDIYAEEWGFFFCHGGHSSWIRVTDIAFVHGRDDFQLLSLTPPLRDVGALLRKFEQINRVKFHRQHALVKTNLPTIEPAIRSWIASL